MFRSLLTFVVAEQKRGAMRADGGLLETEDFIPIGGVSIRGQTVSGGLDKDTTWHIAHRQTYKVCLSSSHGRGQSRCPRVEQQERR